MDEQIACSGGCPEMGEDVTLYHLEMVGEWKMS
jgi:hypothetical protein